MKDLHVRITFTEDVLGTIPANEKIYSEFIASNAPDAKTREQEIAELGIEEVEVKSTTIFPKDNGIPFFYDYQWKGFFKDACSALSRCPDTKSKELKAYKKVIDGTIFVFPRKIHIITSGDITICQRPLRGQTAQGERISLASSESIPKGSTCEFTIKLLNPANEKVLREWLDYGELKGTGQWRNSGKGRFVTEYL